MKAISQRRIWAVTGLAVMAAFAFPHLVPPQFYRCDEDRLSAFAAQLDRIPLPPDTQAVNRYPEMARTSGNGGDFTHFKMRRMLRTRLNLNEVKRHFAKYRVRSALYTLPFDGTSQVPVEILHGNDFDAQGNPDPQRGSVVWIEINDVAQDDDGIRGQYFDRIL